MAPNKISGVDQFIHENLTWERALNFYLQENAFLKTRLSQVLDEHGEELFVAQAEQFQNKFIHRDEYIKDIKEDIIASRKLLTGYLSGKMTDEKKMVDKQQKLRNEMIYVENDFSALKKEFNQYLVSCCAAN